MIVGVVVMGLSMGVVRLLMFWFYILLRCGCCEIVGVLNMVIGIVGVIIACLLVFGLLVGWWASWCWGVREACCGRR